MFPFLNRNSASTNFYLMKENNKSSGFCWGLVAGMVLELLIECVVEVGETIIIHSFTGRKESII